MTSGASRLTSVPSVPYAEAVLLLRRSADAAFGVAEVARALYVAERTAEELQRGDCETAAKRAC